LSQYPDGEYANAAKLRLGNLKWNSFKGTARKLLKYIGFTESGGGLVRVTRDKKMGFINENGDEVIPAIYDDIEDYTLFRNGLARVSRAEKWGYINRKGQEVIPPRFHAASEFSEGLAWVRIGTGISSDKCGFINTDGKEIIRLNSCSISFPIKEFSGGYAIVESEGKYGFIDKTGRAITSAEYSQVEPFSEGLSAVEEDDKWGFINNAGKLMIPLKFDHGASFSEDLAAAAQNGKWGFIDKKGNTAIPFKYDSTESFKGEFARVRYGSRYGAIDKKGNTIIPLRYAGVFYSPEERVFTAWFDDKKEAVFDETGKQITPFKYERVDGFAEDLADVEINGKRGYINRQGEEVIPLRFDAFEDECPCLSKFFSEGLALVKLNETYGFVDKNGKLVVPIKYEDVWCDYFRSEGFIGVVLNGRRGFVDIYGNEHFDFS
jgi:hypothetical protein